LLELSDSPQFQAILRYAGLRFSLVTDALRAIDPFKNPTEIARNQGIGTGLMDLRDYINLLKKKVAESEQKTPKK